MIAKLAGSTSRRDTGVVLRVDREACLPGCFQEHAFMCQRLVLAGLVFGSVLMAATISAIADEGMWVFNNLPLGTLKARHGFEPPAGWADHLRSSAVRVNNGGGGGVLLGGGGGITK